jgi:hypothetical protein
MDVTMEHWAPVAKFGKTSINQGKCNVYSFLSTAIIAGTSPVLWGSWNGSRHLINSIWPSEARPSLTIPESASLVFNMKCQ